MVDITT